MTEQPEPDYRVVATGIEKSFGDLEVLRGVSFAVPRGTATTIIGPSGSGKTTLLRALNALDIPDAGVIRVYDEEVDFSKPVPKERLRRFRLQSGFVFQQHNLFPHKTVLENLTVGPIIAQKRPAEEVRAEAIALLDRVGLADKRDQYPFQLSGGQQQRVGIARAIVTDPTLIVADEPTGDLDSKSAQEILALLVELCKSLGKTIIMVTHDPRAALRANRTQHLDKGVLVDEPDMSPDFT